METVFLYFFVLASTKLMERRVNRKHVHTKQYSKFVNILKLSCGTIVELFHIFKSWAWERNDTYPITSWWKNPIPIIAMEIDTFCTFKSLRTHELAN